MKSIKPILASLVIAVSVLSCNNPQKSTKNQLPTADNSRNSLDWAGTYHGIVPCADCEGIETLLNIQNDLSYTLKTKYLGKDSPVFESTGTFSWNEQGSIIQLKDSKDATQSAFYQVGENQLFQLDMKGKKITGELANNYILKKADNSIFGKSWALITLDGAPVSNKETLAKEPFIRFNEAEGSFSGNGSCNGFFGNYKLSETNGIEFSEIAATKMACMNMKVEKQFFNLLREAKKYSVSNGILQLSSRDDKALLSFEVAYFME